MGYTHYFTKKEDVSLNDWKQITDSFTLVVNNLPDVSQTAGGYHSDEPIILQYDYDDPRPLQIDDDAIIFNGVEDLGHETFYLPRGDSDEPNGFQFCKTARKPYDHAVCAALILVNYYAPDSHEISSDGEPEDWMPALTHVRTLLNNPNIKLPLNVGIEPIPLSPETFGPNNEWFFA